MLPLLIAAAFLGAGACASVPAPAVTTARMLPDTSAVFSAEVVAAAMQQLGVPPFRADTTDTATAYRVVTLSFPDLTAIAYTLHPVADSGRLEVRVRTSQRPMRRWSRELSAAEWSQLWGYEEEWRHWPRTGRGPASEGVDGSVVLLECVVGGTYYAWSTGFVETSLGLLMDWLWYHRRARG